MQVDLNTHSQSKNSLPDDWKKYLDPEFSKDYMINLKNFLTAELKLGKSIFPHGKEMLSAFSLTPFNKVKVVIIGQDPYHGKGQAHGLSFSVKPGTPIPPSLQNIYKELVRDIPNFQIPNHGYLENWAKEGVLMLNAVLTVEEGKPASHRKKGWETFTDVVIETLNNEKENLVFILWGRDAAEKGKKINEEKHLVLRSAHPSPFSVTKFFGNRHFSRCNEYLKQHQKGEINWAL